MKSSDGQQADTDAGLARAQSHLEWDRLAREVLARCKGLSTQRRGVQVADDLEHARTALHETAEVMRLLQAGEALPLDDLRDVDGHLARLARGGVLDGPALADLRVTLRAGLNLRAFVANRKDRLPALMGACLLDPSLDALDDTLAGAVGFDGNLHDQASAELRRLRTECANLRARIVGRLDQFIEQHRDLLSDRFYTLREGRYVVPVRSDAHDRVPGIVHATSDSGASVFVEPRAIVTQGNRLKMAQGELEREEGRILSALSTLVAERLQDVDTAAATLAHFDLRNAGARLAVELDATVPELTSTGHADLRAARHPLLELDGLVVVPNDIVLRPGQGVVISGPNAGGKTVLLKTLGLLSLMVRAGLPIPVDDGSALGFFDPILTDLGDEQSTQKNLSTFSAHVQSLARILARTGPGTLVLLDEVCGGTDPEEGAALACAVVHALVEAGATLLVTTHYEALKAYSLQDEHLRSASVGFDLEHMAPNFALTLDVPGASSALRVAARFGIPEAVIEHAERVLPQQAKDFDLLVRKLETQAQALGAQQQELARERANAEALRREHDRRLDALKQQSRRKLTVEADRVMAELRKAREEVGRVKAALRDSEPSESALKTAEKALQYVAARLALGGDLEIAASDPVPPPAPHSGRARLALSVGDSVYVPHLRSQGTVLELDEKNDRARIAAGPIKLWTERDKLTAPPSDHEGRAARGRDPAGAARGQAQGTGSAPTAAQPPEPPALRTSDNTLVLKGMRIDDALPMMESFVDRMLMGAGRVGYIVHGHGTGALRKAVREHLQQHVHQVTRTRPGDQDEGGDAVTVFYLR